MKQADLWLVFDLGGVLFDFHGVHALADMTGRTYDTVHASLKHSPACRLFETGKVTGEEFAALLVGELDLDLPPAELLRLWVEWLGPAKPGTVDLMREVRARHNTACLSNTNHLHWAGLMDIHGVGGLFDRTYASHEIGYWKPDPNIFAHVAEALGPEVRRIVYFDDNIHIVEGARAFGWDAYQALSPEDIRAVLGRLGL